MRIANRVASIVLLLFGLYIIFESTKLKFMIDGNPGPGFLPIWIGIVLSIVAVIPLTRTFVKSDENKPHPFARKEFKTFYIFIGSSIFVLLITPITGLLIALGLMVGGTAKLQGTKSWITVAALTVCTPLVFFGLFVAILGVPIPTGIFGI